MAQVNKYIVVLGSCSFGKKGDILNAKDLPKGAFVKDDKGKPTSDLTERASLMLKPYVAPKNAGDNTELEAENAKLKAQLAKLTKENKTLVANAGDNTEK